MNDKFIFTHPNYKIFILLVRHFSDRRWFNTRDFYRETDYTRGVTQAQKLLKELEAMGALEIKVGKKHQNFYRLTENGVEQGQITLNSIESLKGKSIEFKPPEQSPTTSNQDTFPQVIDTALCLAVNAGQVTEVVRRKVRGNFYRPSKRDKKEVTENLLKFNKEMKAKLSDCARSLYRLCKYFDIDFDSLLNLQHDQFIEQKIAGRERHRCNGKTVDRNYRL